MAVTNKFSTHGILSICCTILVFINCFAISIPASAETGTALTVSSATAEKGDTITVSVNLKDNVGLWGLKFKVGYDHSILTLTSAENGDVFEDEDVMLPGSLDKEQFVYLAYLNRLQNNTADGTIVTLKFSVSEEAEFKPYVITLAVEQAIDVDGEDVNLSTEDGAVSVVKCIHVINPDWESNADSHWHNCAQNGCGEKIESTISAHQFVDVPEVKATCTGSGITEGTKCSVCGEVLKGQEVIPATGHTSVVVPEVKATCTESGLTEGITCSVCGEVLKGQELVPAIGHTLVVVTAVKATTEKTGLTEGKKCVTCGTIVVPQKTVPKIPYKMMKSAKTTGKIKMYKNKKTTSKIINTIKKGVKVTIVDINGTWYKIKYNGKLGFVKSKSVTWIGKVNTQENLRLRLGAGTKYKTLDSFPSGTAVTVVASTSNGWYKVQVKKGKYSLVGYMSAKYIK